METREGTSSEQLNSSADMSTENEDGAGLDMEVDEIDNDSCVGTSEAEVEDEPFDDSTDQLDNKYLSSTQSRVLEAGARTSTNVTASEKTKRKSEKRRKSQVRPNTCCPCTKASKCVLCPCAKKPEGCDSTCFTKLCQFKDPQRELKRLEATGMIDVTFSDIPNKSQSDEVDPSQQEKTVSKPKDTPDSDAMHIQFIQAEDLSSDEFTSSGEEEGEDTESCSEQETQKDPSALHIEIVVMSGDEEGAELKGGTFDEYVVNAPKASASAASNTNNPADVAVESTSQLPPLLPPAQKKPRKSFSMAQNNRRMNQLKEPDFDYEESVQEMRAMLQPDTTAASPTSVAKTKSPKKPEKKTTVATKKKTVASKKTKEAPKKKTVTPKKKKVPTATLR